MLFLVLRVQQVSCLQVLWERSHAGQSGSLRFSQRSPSLASQRASFKRSSLVLSLHFLSLLGSLLALEVKMQLLVFLRNCATKCIRDGKKPYFSTQNRPQGRFCVMQQGFS